MLRDYFHNPFLSDSLLPEHLTGLAEIHLEKLKALNPGKPFDQQIEATEKLISQYKSEEKAQPENPEEATVSEAHKSLAVQLYKNLGMLITLFAEDPDQLHQFYGDQVPGTRKNAL